MKTNRINCFPCQIIWALLLLLITVLAQAQSVQGVIRGQIYQFDGVTQIGNATVEALGVSPGTPYMTTTTTDTTGGYSLTLPVGSYRVRAAAPGYAREYFDNVTPSNEATVLNVTGGTNITADFNLTEGGAIAGHIYQSDGVMPITNANVFIRPSNYFFDDDSESIPHPMGATRSMAWPLASIKSQRKVQIMRIKNTMVGIMDGITRQT